MEQVREQPSSTSTSRWAAPFALCSYDMDTRIWVRGFRRASSTMCAIRCDPAFVNDEALARSARRSYTPALALAEPPQVYAVWCTPVGVMVPGELVPVGTLGVMVQG